MAFSVPVQEGPVAAALDRAIALVVLVLGLLVIAALARIQPDARGHGTHEALGMTPCGWPQLYGKPCPTCGVTTAACLLVHLAPLHAIATQPFGAVLAAIGIGLAVFALRCLWRGRSFLEPFTRMPYARITVIGLSLFLGSWLYKYLTF